MIKSIFFFTFLTIILTTKTTTQRLPGLRPLPIPPITPRPLCKSQINLANHACGLLPYTPLLPASSYPPPPPPNDPPRDEYEDNDRRRRHHHHHDRHRHRHRHHHHETPTEQECCRWLKELDSECVCSLLVHLAPFMIRPLHEYTITVENVCNVTYYCPSVFLS
ncbi:uncharacterized protein LOC124929901 [Impatiens glandulifera]|uniref:uncharacterized protein LOC124929901 n=1 Tax=Impatiens glandulifera TaxID=253017 RepID=UPI001FB17E60|nr:uncharacterized protein LOC124929901 [Impatiens glandulifera]